MTFFKPKQKILQRKQLSSNAQQFLSMQCIRVRFLEKLSLSGIYTCVDQAMVVWGVLAAIIFFGGQFLPIDWVTQGIFWSIFTFFGVGIMTYLTYSWTLWEKISPLLHTWIFLMIFGTILTDCSLIYGWGWFIGYLCHFWLLISAIGYFISGWIVRSRAFFLASIIHGLAIICLPLVMGWQFAFTGLIMMGNLFIFSEGQWDMLLPRELKEYSTVKVDQNVKSMKNYSIVMNR